jgi:hypothetical protein
VLKTLKAVKFLFVGPLIVLMLFVINLMTSPGHWWVQWPAFGIGIAWVVSLLRVIRAIVVAGGLAALAAVLLKYSGNGPRAGRATPHSPTRAWRLA